MERMDADLLACEALLEGSGAFLTGATPTQADCSLFGLLDHVRAPPAFCLLLSFRGVCPGMHVYQACICTPTAAAKCAQFFCCTYINFGICYRV